MAERRMFAKSIIDSDAFVEMPMSTQCLYFHLGMKADDDGVVNNPKSIMRMIGAKEDDMNVLIAKKFVLVLDNQVIVIKHWKINNYIQNDRYVPSKYKHLIEQLELDENKSYKVPCIQPVSNMDTQVSIGKVSLVKSNEKEKNNINVIPKEKMKRFIKPTIEEIQKYCDERHNNINAQRFYDHYESKGWMIGKSPMKDWKAAVRIWESVRMQSENQNKESEFKITKFDVN